MSSSLIRRRSSSDAEMTSSPATTPSAGPASSSPAPAPSGSARSPRRRRSAAATPRRGGTMMRSAATRFVGRQALTAAQRRAFTDDGELTPTAESWLTRAVTVQRPLVLANLRRLRKAHPTHTNRQLAEELDREFVRTMTGGGAVIGATAAVPSVGTVTSLGLSAAATGGFLESSALYAQSVAELSGISTEDPQQAQLLVMSVMLGDEGRELLGELNEQAGGRSTGPFASLVPLTSPMGSSSGLTGLVVEQIRRRFVRRFFVRQGTSMLGRALPFGIGAAVGGAANHRLARQIVDSARETFGELPEETPQSVVDDFARGLEREKQRAERREKRTAAKQQKAARRRLRRGAEPTTPDPTSSSPAPAEESEADEPVVQRDFT